MTNLRSFPLELGQADQCLLRSRTVTTTEWRIQRCRVLSHMPKQIHYRRTDGIICLRPCRQFQLYALDKMLCERVWYLNANVTGKILIPHYADDGVKECGIWMQMPPYALQVWCWKCEPRAKLSWREQHLKRLRDSNQKRHERWVKFNCVERSVAWEKEWEEILGMS